MSRTVTPVCFGSKLNGIIAILQNTTEKRRFCKLFQKSDIRMKKSFLNYLQFCRQKGLVERKVLAINSNGQPNHSEYLITDKGRKFLEMIQ